MGQGGEGCEGEVGGLRRTKIPVHAPGPSKLSASSSSRALMHRPRSSPTRILSARKGPRPLVAFTRLVRVSDHDDDGADRSLSFRGASW